MPNLSLREAVKHFDVSRPTLQNALKNGKISGVKDGKGQWTIDPAEMARIYRPRLTDMDKVDKPLPEKLSTMNNPLAGEVDTLRKRLSDAEQRAAVAEALAAERGKRLDQLIPLLPAPSPSRPWWRRIFD